jgi:hypothetical protein
MVSRNTEPYQLTLLSARNPSIIARMAVATMVLARVDGELQADHDDGQVEARRVSYSCVFRQLILQQGPVFRGLVEPCLKRGRGWIKHVSG